MGTRNKAVLGALFLLGWMMGQIVPPLWGQASADKPEAAAAKASDEPAPSAEERAIMVRYAQTYLKLMEATLAKFEEINRRNPNTIRPTVLQAIGEAVAKARDRVKWVESGSLSNSQLCVMRAETDLRINGEILGRAEAANRRVADAVSPGEVARLRAEREFLQVKLERARHLASESPISNVRFEIEQLREDLQDLRLVVAVIRSGRLN